MVQDTGRKANFTPVIDWPERLPKAEWALYRQILQATIAREIPFALGGAVALGAYTGKWRNTKDLDIYVVPQNVNRMQQVLTEAGLADYYDTQQYDRDWIYRASNGQVLIDIIWAMANQRASVDEGWLRGPEATVDGLRVRILPPEELIWSKLYVIQRERCDWPDILNIVYATRQTLDWDHLMTRVGEDAPLLNGVLSIFSWLCPEKNVEPSRANLLDSRPWFQAAAARDNPERSAA